jgi:hypothetical protein
MYLKVRPACLGEAKDVKDAKLVNIKSRNYNEVKNLSLSLFRILNLISHLNVFLSSDMKNYLRNWNLLLFLLLSSIFLLLKKEDLKNYDQEIRRRGCKKTSAFT